MRAASDTHSLTATPLSLSMTTVMLHSTMALTPHVATATTTKGVEAPSDKALSHAGAAGLTYYQ